MRAIKFKILLSLLFSLLCICGFSQKLKSVELGKKFTLKLNETVKVGDSLAITFNGNTHKSVMAGGPESPLGFAFTYSFAGKKVGDDHWEYEKAPYTWVTNKYKFTIYSCEYDSKVEMKVEKVVAKK